MTAKALGITPLPTLLGRATSGPSSFHKIKETLT
jgi:hypothetical protein